VIFRCVIAEWFGIAENQNQSANKIFKSRAGQFVIRFVFHKPGMVVVQLQVRGKPQNGGKVKLGHVAAFKVLLKMILNSVAYPSGNTQPACRFRFSHPVFPAFYRII